MNNPKPSPAVQVKPLEPPAYPGAVALHQLSLFGQVSEFEASPLSLIVDPHPGIRAAVAFPIPLAHLGEAYARVTCRALLGLSNGALLVVESPQPAFAASGFWEKAFELRRGAGSFVDDVQRCNSISIGVMSDLESWPLQSYMRSRQFDRFCEGLSALPTEPGQALAEVEREIGVARARAVLQQQLTGAVDTLIAILESPPAQVGCVGPDVRAMASLLEVRGDLPVNLWSDLEMLPLATRAGARARLRQAMRDWPLPLLRTALGRDPLASALRNCIETSSSLVSALAAAGVSRPAIRRLMRLGRRFPRMDTYNFRRTLKLASSMSADVVPVEPAQWAALANLQREARWVHRALSEEPLLTRLCHWCWLGCDDDTSAPEERLRRLSGNLGLIVDPAGTYTDDEVVVLADLLLAWPPSEMATILQRVRAVRRALRDEAIELAAARLGLHGTGGLLAHLLSHLPEIPSYSDASGFVFALAGEAEELRACGAKLDNCLALEATCVDFMLSEELIFIIRSARGKTCGALSVVLAGDAAARLGQCELKAGLAGAADVQKVVTWLSEAVFPATDFVSYRAVVKRAGDAVAAELKAMDRLAVWRRTLGRSKATSRGDEIRQT